MSKVKVSTLKRELEQMKEEFSEWDTQRKLKVDMVVKSLGHEPDYIDLETVHERLNKLSKQGRAYRELTPAAKKMLDVHYKSLARSQQKVAEDTARYEMALLRKEAYENKIGKDMSYSH